MQTLRSPLILCQHLLIFLLHILVFVCSIVTEQETLCKDKRISQALSPFLPSSPIIVTRRALVAAALTHHHYGPDSRGFDLVLDASSLGAGEQNWRVNTKCLTEPGGPTVSWNVYTHKWAANQTPIIIIQPFPRMLPTRWHDTDKIKCCFLPFP